MVSLLARLVSTVVQHSPLYGDVRRMDRPYAMLVVSIRRRATAPGPTRSRKTNRPLSRGRKPVQSLAVKEPVQVEAPVMAQEGRIVAKGVQL